MVWLIRCPVSCYPMPSLRLREAQNLKRGPSKFSPQRPNQRQLDIKGRHQSHNSSRMSVEALTSYVLQEVALDGDSEAEGTTIPKLFQYVADFYKQHRQRRFRIDRLCEAADEALESDSEYFSTQNLSQTLKKKIWKQLAGENDFLIGKNNEGKDLSLESVEATYVQYGEKAGTKGFEKESEWEQEAGTEGELTKKAKLVKWRVYAMEERRWRALTGHGIDHKKVPPKFFDLLTEIGKHREEGILQPTLTKITGQDARSVGPRTAALAKMGYVEKVNVLAAKLRTSKLTLQSYATRRDLKANQVKERTGQNGDAEKDKSANSAWTGDTVDVRKMVEAIFEELRKAKNNVLMHSDLKRKLGMDKSRFHFRAFARIIRRVEKTGCLRRIRVPLQLTRFRKQKSGEPGDYTDRCLARCIKLVREPTEWDWEQTLNVIMKKNDDDVDVDGAMGDEDDDADKNGDKEDEVVDDEAVARLENAGEDLVEESSRILPKWTADRSMENIIYDVVDASGMTGISSMDLHQAVAGRFYYRPLDQVLRRLGDDPLKSQPPHLLRLAIIRETDIEGRHTHYRYFSYRWHQKLVEAGLGKPMGGFKKSHTKGKAKEEKPAPAPPKRVTVATDQLGFSFIDKRRLLRSDGSATLKEAQDKLPVPESENVLKSKYNIITTADGKSAVEWMNSWGTKTKTPKKKAPVIDDNAPEIPKKRGRPPKDHSGPMQKKNAKQDSVASTPLTRCKKRMADHVEFAVDAEAGIEEPHSQPPRKKLRAKNDDPDAPPPRLGRPRKPDHELKRPRKMPKKGAEAVQEALEPSLMEIDDASTEKPLETSKEIIPLAPAPSRRRTRSSLNSYTEELAALADYTAPDVNTHGIEKTTIRPMIVAELGQAAVLEEAPALQTSVRQTPVPETSTPKRRGRPPRCSKAETLASTSRETRSKAKAVEILGRARKIPSYFKTRSMSRVENSEAQPVVSNSSSKGPTTVHITGEKPQKRATESTSTEEILPVIKLKGPETAHVETADTSPKVRERELEAPATAIPDTSMEEVEAVQELAQASLLASPAQRPRRQSARFSASVDAVAEEMSMTPVPITPPRKLELPSVENAKCSEATIHAAAALTPLSSSFKASTGRKYKTAPIPQSKQPRTEPTMILEEVDDSTKLSYGSAGGMLMIARQRVILELIEENGGVFPGGLEIKHAFESRYKKKNPKAGQPDRRLMVSLVSSLQRSGKINQIVINFINSRGLRQTKRILADAKLPLDSPLIRDMKNKLVAADGNLWFPEGTEIPKEAQKLANVVRGLPTQPGAIETVEFERMYMPTRQLVKEQKAGDNRLARIMRESKLPRFTAEQKEVAAKRLEHRRRKEAAMSRIQLAEDDEAWDAPTDTEDSPAQHYWWRNFTDRPDVKAFNDFQGWVSAPSMSSSSVLHPAAGIPDLPQAKDENDVMKGIKDVFLWEKRQIWMDDELHCHLGFNIINHNAPEPHIPEGSDFHRGPANMDHIIRTVQPARGNKGTLFSRVPKRAGPKLRAAQKALNIGAEYAVEGPNGEMIFKQTKQKPKLAAPGKQRTSRRDRAMAELYSRTGPLGEDNDMLEALPSRNAVVPRRRHAFDHDLDEVLLAAIVIVRTLFGGYDRRIDWNLVRTAFPRHDLNTLKARWPRVRDAHRTHLKKLQVDFEEVYLDAYEKGLIPPVRRGDPANFDLPWHTKWFRENVTVPEAKSVPELTNSREEFDEVYDLRAEKSSWRDEYHNPALTGENRKSYMSSHAFEISLFEMPQDQRPYEDQKELECIKSLIKANILTDIPAYDARKAFSMLSSYRLDNIDKAFYFLTGNKMLAPKKDAEKLVPGRNYEFTERFHLSLRVQVGGRMWSQAIAFEKFLQQEFAGYFATLSPSSEQSKETSLPEVDLSPFMNDGTVMALFDLIANRYITISKSRYISNIHGLITGYRTRGMDKERIDFPISCSPTLRFPTRALLTQSPLLSTRPPPVPNSKDFTQEPVKLWYDINGGLVVGMWRKCVSAVLGTMMIRPGVTVQEVVRILWPGLTVSEVEDVVGWLVGSGAVEKREVSEVGCGVWGLWAKEGYFWALGA